MSAQRKVRDRAFWSPEEWAAYRTGRSVIEARVTKWVAICFLATGIFLGWLARGALA